MVASATSAIIESVTWLRLQVPDWVHRRLKAGAALAGLTLHEYLNKILREAAEDKNDDDDLGAD